MGFYFRTFGQVLKNAALETLFGIKPNPDGRQWADLPYGSGVNGADRVMAKILGLEAEMAQAMLRVIQEGSNRVRMAMAQLVPRDTQHLRMMLLDDRAIYIDAKNLVAYVGFRKELRDAWSSTPHKRHKTPSRLHSEGIYAVWVNNGRSMHAIGSQRAAGRDKRGRQRFRRVDRSVGPMQASRFMERALDMYRPHIQRLREQALRDAIHIKIGGGRP